MVRCPNCNDELGTETHCKACGASIDQHDGERPRTEQTPPRQRSERGREQPHRQQSPAFGESRQPRRDNGRSLPGGLKLIAAGLALFGIGSLFGAVLLDQVTQRVPVYGPSPGGAGLADFAIVFAVLGVADLAAAYGLWTRQSWGWTAGMAALGAGVLSGLFVLANGSAGMGLFSTLVYGGLGWYLREHRWAYAEGQQRRPARHQRGAHQQLGNQRDGR